METKSRYEVIADLESKKRELINERDNLANVLLAKQRELKMAERKKSDHIMVLDREIEDMKEDIKNFEAQMKDRKETINKLIVSVDDSLARFK